MYLYSTHTHAHHIYYNVCIYMLHSTIYISSSHKTNLCFWKICVVYIYLSAQHDTCRQQEIVVGFATRRTQPMGTQTLTKPVTFLSHSLFPLLALFGRSSDGSSITLERLPRGGRYRFRWARLSSCQTSTPVAWPPSQEQLLAALHMALWALMKLLILQTGKSEKRERERAQKT